MVRTFLGREQGLGGYRRVYRIEGGLEVDENSFIEIERTRVYFDDVVAITYHREIGTAYLVVMGVFAVIFLTLALVVYLSTKEVAGLAVFLGFAAPFTLGFLLRVLLRVDVITVYGQRTKARLNFSFRKERARGIFQDLTRDIRARQEKAASALRPPPQPPPPDLPPSPPAAVA